ncbi:hypothetical protein PR048_014104 [Dryococelus australis]|uniref:Uncharacterized protein n=1 Tax=Dryococelus australis TaxID=614101 RepID=A0ABQ9HD85_9NEOP|nr:hypothetical protein PR048_014104 [Dryococelus australis]
MRDPAAELWLGSLQEEARQHRNERAEETGNPRENPPTSGIVRHDSHLRKSGVNWPVIEPGSPWWEGCSLPAEPPWPLV